MARQRAYLLITIFALLLVLFPFLFWYGTWFGRKLTDAQIGEYLGDRAKPRHARTRWCRWENAWLAMIQAPRAGIRKLFSLPAAR